MPSSKTATNLRRKKTLTETKLRRKNQIPVVFQLKIVKQNKAWFRQAMDKINLLFLESKWLYNHIVADVENRLTKNSWKLTSAEIKVGNAFESRKIQTLSSQMRQGIIKNIKQNLTSLKVLKNKGEKVGKLKFKKVSNSILLPQYGNTFKFLNKQKTKVRIQGFRKPFRVLGGHQIPKDAEIANAYLVRKPSGIYLHVVCYVAKDKYKFIWEHPVTKHGKIKKRQWQTFDKPIGVDFKPNGIVLSNGMKLQLRIEETPRLKKLQRKLARQKCSSHNYKKTKEKIQLEYERIKNKKIDAINKIASYLYRYDTIYYQDENIKSWHKRRKGNLNFSKSIQYSAVGVILRRLKNSLRVPTVQLDRFIATTKTCSRCGNKVEKITIKDRVFVCPSCGLKIDRDLNSAVNMLKFGGVHTLGLDGPEVTPVEWKTAAKVFGSNPNILVSHATKKQKTQSQIEIPS